MLAILSYHKIGPPSPDAWETWYYVPEETLAAQLRTIAEAGWHFVDARALVKGLSSPDGLPERSAVVTFDDGYHSLRRALPLLSELDCPATVFVPTAYVGDRSVFDENTPEPPEPLCDWDELRELDRAGVSVQSHGVSHRTFSELSPAELEEELVRSKADLEERLGKPVELFAFPYGDAGVDPPAVQAALKRAGYHAAFLYGGGPVDLSAADPYALPRVTVGPDTDVASELASSVT